MPALEDGLVDPCQGGNKSAGHKFEKLRCVPIWAWGFPIGKAGNCFLNFLFGDSGVESDQYEGVELSLGIPE